VPNHFRPSSGAGVGHQVARLGIAEDQVFGQLVFGDIEIRGHAVVAHVLQRMATHAVVGEVLGAALQRGLVFQVDIGLLQRRSLGRREAPAGQQAAAAGRLQ
jgi:hypothetical protein